MPYRRYCDMGPREARVAHLHIVALDHPFWRDHLAFRDWLRAHPEDAVAYATLKRDLAARYRDDRVAYTDAKGPFISAILVRAAGHVSDTLRA